MRLTNFGMVMERSTYFLVSLLALAAGALQANDNVQEDELTASHGEVAALKKQSRGLDVVSGDTHRIKALEEQMNEVYTNTTRDTFGAKAAIARPQLDNYRLYVSGDALYWKAFEGGKDYADVANAISPPMEGTTKRVDFDWAPGFRAAIGYRTAHDGWDLVGHYTWFFDKGHSDVEAPPSEGASPHGGVTSLFYTFADNHGLIAESWADVHFQEGDLSLQKSYFLSRQFSLAWTAALRSVWINQSAKDFSYSPRAGGQLSRTLELNGKNDFWGIGPKMGFATTWFIDRNWHFFGSFAGSLLYSEFDVRIKTEENGFDPPKYFKADLHQISPTVQASIGMGWEMNFLCDHYHIALNVAYETQYWWRQNQFFSYLPASGTSIILKRLSDDLGFHGLTINALFDF